MLIPNKKVQAALKALSDKLLIGGKYTDEEIIKYLYFEKVFYISELEQFFNGKYTYKELKAMTKKMYKDYYDTEENDD